MIVLRAARGFRDGATAARQGWKAPEVPPVADLAKTGFSQKVTTMTTTTVLTGHTSADTAYLVTDYPYGFRLRCQIRYWIETTKHGSRVVSQTTNPKKPGLVWNKPKASTYTNLRVLYLDGATGYVENAGLTYADTDKIAAFEALYGAALTSERDQKMLKTLKATAAILDARAAARLAAGSAA